MQKIEAVLGQPLSVSFSFRRITMALLDKIQELYAKYGEITSQTVSCLQIMNFEITGIKIDVNSTSGNTYVSPSVVTSSLIFDRNICATVSVTQKNKLNLLVTFENKVMGNPTVESFSSLQHALHNILEDIKKQQMMQNQYPHFGLSTPYNEMIIADTLSNIHRSVHDMPPLEQPVKIDVLTPNFMTLTARNSISNMLITISRYSGTGVPNTAGIHISAEIVFDDKRDNKRYDNILRAGEGKPVANTIVMTLLKAFITELKHEDVSPIVEACLADCRSDVRTATGIYRLAPFLEILTKESLYVSDSTSDKDKTEDAVNQSELKGNTDEDKVE